jgi:predicted amidohydrolase
VCRSGCSLAAWFCVVNGVDGASQHRAIDDILTSIDGGGSSTLEIARRLLLFLRDRHEDYGRDRLAVAPRRFRAIVESAVRILYCDPANVITPEQGRRLSPGDPVPVASKLVEVLKKEVRTTNPFNLPAGQRGDRLGNLSLAPASVGALDVRFDFSLSDSIDEMVANKGAAGLSVAVCLPTVDFTQDYHAAELSETQEQFFNVVPNSPKHLDRLKACFKEACDRNADLVVFPELSFTEDMQEGLRDQWLATSPRPTIVSLGSCHRTDEFARRTNTAKIAADATILGNASRANVSRFIEAHHKVVPYVERSHVPDGVPQLTERIDYRPIPTLRIFSGGASTTLAIVICIDFLNGRVRDVLRDLLVDILILPAMTRKAQVFHDLITGFVGSTQAHVVFANSTVSVEGTHAMIGHPYGKSRVTVIGREWKVAHSNGECADRGVVFANLTDANSAGPEWVSLSAELCYD